MFSSHRRSNLILYALIAMLGVLVLAPTLRWLANEWWSNDYYSHGILVPIISVFFAWRLLPKVERKPSNLGLFLLVAALVIYLGALFQRAYFIAALGMIALFAGLIWYLVGRSGTQAHGLSPGLPDFHGAAAFCRSQQPASLPHHRPDLHQSSPSSGHGCDSAGRVR